MPTNSRIKEIIFHTLSDFVLWLKYGWKKRYRESYVSIHGSRFLTNDVKSAMIQLSEIYVHQDFNMPEGIKNEAKIIIDCGANIGITCRYFLENFPKAKIIAYEADPAIYPLLVKNIPDRLKSRIELINKAVWIHNESILFSQEGSASGNIFDTTNQVKVQSERLADVLIRFQQIDILKIDIEGAEIEVLLDCKEQIGKVKNLFVEYHSFVDQPQRLAELLEVLTNAGFRYFMREAYVPKMPRFIWMNSPRTMDLQLNIYAVKKML